MKWIGRAASSLFCFLFFLSTPFKHLHSNPLKLRRPGDTDCNETFIKNLRSGLENELFYCQKFLVLLTLGPGRDKPESKPEKRRKNTISFPFSTHFCKCSHFWERYQELQLLAAVPGGMSEWQNHHHVEIGVVFALERVTIAQWLCPTASIDLLCTNKNCAWLSGWQIKEIRLIFSHWE